MDKIFISELLLRCIIGVNEYERKVYQDVVIDIVIYTDTAKAGKSDNIDDTVNYKNINKDIIAFVEKSECYLIEALAEHISCICLKHNSVYGCKVRVDKPGALRFTRKVGVEIERWNKNRESS